MALAIDASTPAIVTNAVSGTATVTTASFTPPAGSLLLVMWAGNNTNTILPSTPTITDSLGSPLTYTLLDYQSKNVSPNVQGQAASWWAVVGSSAAMTVTVTNVNNDSVNRHAALAVVVITGQHATPIGAHGKAGSASASSIAQSYTAQATGGWGFLASCDWDAKGTDTAGTGCTLLPSGSGTIPTTQISYAFERRTSADDTNGSNNTLNLTLPATSTNLNWVYVEVVPAATTLVFPPQPPHPRRGLPFRAAKARQTAPVRAQVNPPWQPPPVHRTRQVMARLRGRVALFAPPQVVVPPPPYVPPPVHRLRQVLGRIRGRSIAPVPAQVVVPPPPYVPAERSPRRFAVLLRRPHATIPPPTTALPPAPTSRLRRLPFVARRRSVTPAPVTTLPPPPLARPRRALFMARRRQATPVPPQIVIVPPAYPPQPVYKRLLAFVTRRGRAAAPVAPQVAAPPPANAASSPTVADNSPASGVVAAIAASTGVVSGLQSIVSTTGAPATSAVGGNAASQPTVSDG